MKKLILGSFLAALALFFWGFIYYGISGIPYKFLGQSSDTVALLLKESFPADGTYILPNPTSEDMQELMQRGPVATVHIKRGGFDQHATMMASGFVHGWIYCLLLALLLNCVGKKMEYGRRVGFIALVGIIGAFLARFGDAIWWHQSWSWQFSNFAYTAIGSALAGLVLAKFVSKEEG